MTPPLVTARGLTKRFDDFTAVDAIDFDIHRGEVFGFLGPNGAGKSSTMRMIGATSPITGGSLSVFGLDPEQDGRHIVVVSALCHRRTCSTRNSASVIGPRLERMLLS